MRRDVSTRLADGLLMPYPSLDTVTSNGVDDV